VRDIGDELKPWPTTVAWNTATTARHSPHALNTLPRGVAEVIYFPGCGSLIQGPQA